MLMTSCGTAPTLLDTDDLPAVSKTESGDQGAPGTGWCDALGYLETAKLSNAGDRTTGTQYVLEDGDVVGATMFTTGGRYPDTSSMLTAVEEAVEKCTSDAKDGKAGDVAVTPLDGLPDHAVGYTFTNNSASPRQVGTIAFGSAENGHLVAVGVTHYGDDESKINVVELLDTALERSADVAADE